MNYFTANGCVLSEESGLARPALVKKGYGLGIVMAHQFQALSHQGGAVVLLGIVRHQEPRNRAARV